MDKQRREVIAWSTVSSRFALLVFSESPKPLDRESEREEERPECACVFMKTIRWRSRRMATHEEEAFYSIFFFPSIFFFFFNFLSSIILRTQ